MCWLLLGIICNAPVIHSQNHDSIISNYKNQIEAAVNDSIRLQKLLDYSKYELRHDVSVSDSILNVVEKMVDQNPSYNTVKVQMIYHTQRGITNTHKGDLVAALDSYLIALEITEIAKDSSRLGSAYFNIANIFRRQKEYEKALAYIKKSLPFTERWNEPESVGLTLRSIGINYRRLEQYDSAWYYNDRALKFAESIQDSSGISDAKLSAGLLLVIEEKYEEALPLFKEVARYRKQDNQLYKLSNAYNQVSKAYLAIKQLDSALHYVNKSIQVAENSNFKALLSGGYSRRSEIYAAMNEPQRSLEDLERYVTLYQEVYASEKISEMKSLELSFEFEKARLADSLNYASQRALLEKDIEKRKATRWRNYVIIAVLLILLLLVYLFNRKRRQLEQAEKALLNKELMESERKIETKEAAISDLLVESIQQLQSKKKLKEDLKKVSTGVESDLSLKGIIAELNAEHIEDDKLLLIRKELKAKNFEFHQRLKETYPNLTATDLEICSFIKMGIGRNEIAKLRNTSIAAVRKSRHRLRKKLKLSDDTKLSTFLSTL